MADDVGPGEECMMDLDEQASKTLNNLEWRQREEHRIFMCWLRKQH